MILIIFGNFVDTPEIGSLETNEVFIPAHQNAWYLNSGKGK